MSASLRPAAQYVRMSTDQQRYSIENQCAANAAYALENGFSIVRTYADPARSGVTIAKRVGLRSLLATAIGGSADFEVILVYDVSRWGRFQDPDESAHYEYLCRAAGVDVRYTAEAFPSDGSLMAAMLKHMKRAMAAEFSRDLSARVSRVQRGLGAKGFWMGGPAAYGLARHVVSPDGRRRLALAPGERSALRGDRVILTPGPAAEVRLVRRIFRMFVRDGLTARQIAIRLNSEGRTATYGASWSTIRVRRVLRNEAYIGISVIGRTRHELGRRTHQPPSTWIRTPDAIRPMVSRRLFVAAQARFRRNKPMVDDDALLEELSAALKRHGVLSRGIIDRDPETHCASVYQARFGNLSAAYARIGYQMNPQQAATSAAAFRVRPHLRKGRRSKVSDEEVLARLAEALERYGRLSKELIGLVPGVPHSHALTRRFGGLENLYARLGYTPTARQLQGMRGGRIRRPPDWSTRT